MNENSAWLQEQRLKAQLDAERAYAERVEPDAVITPEPTAEKDRGGRKTRTCSICRAAGLIEEAKGHIALGHDAWLAQQPGHMQAHFKGQGTTGHGAPRLIKTGDTNSE